MEIRNNCFYAKIGTTESTEGAMALLPDDMANELRFFEALEEASEDEITDEEKAKGCELMERKLCPEDGCQTNFLGLMRMVTSAGDFTIIQALKDESLEGCGIKEIQLAPFPFGGPYVASPADSCNTGDNESTS